MIARPLQRLARLPEFALTSAAVLAVAQITGAGSAVAAALGPWLPVDPSSIDPLDAATAAFVLGALAVALRRRKRLALPLAVATFGAAIVAQGIVLRHPLGAALATGCLLVLLVDAGRYSARTDRAMRRLALVVAALGVVVLVAGSLAGGVVGVAPGGSVLGSLAARAAEVLDFVDPTGLVSSDRPDEILEAIEFATRAAVLVVVLAVLAADPDRPRPGQLRRRRETARRHARGALAPFQVGQDKLLFGDVAIVAYGRAGRTAVVLGDPIGPRAAAWSTFRAFADRCAAGDVRLAVYQASGDAVPELEQAGLRVFRVGAEPIVDLRRFGLDGSRRANLRHTIARAERGGTRVAWYADGLTPDDLDRLTPALREIDRRWSERHGPSLGFTISPFDPADLARVGVAVAADADGSIEAFATFRRTEPDAWVLDVMRRRPGSTPGALEACIAGAAAAMREAGDTELSLGLVALAGLSPSSGPLEERVLAVAAVLARHWYDIDGMLRFKRKFDPVWLPRFGAVQGRAGLVGFALSLLRLHLAVGVARPSAPARPPRGVVRLLRRVRARVAG